MITSRKLEDLNPVVRAKMQEFIDKCNDYNVELLVLCTYRDGEAQDELYSHGRKGDPRPVVTNAKSGMSYHQFRCAMDFVPLVDGKPLWQVHAEDGTLLHEWECVKEAAAAVGVEWAGNWHRFVEYDHVQYTGGLELAELQQGKEIT